MASRISLFWRWFRYWRGCDDGFSFTDDIRAAWVGAKKGQPIPGDHHG